MVALFETLDAAPPLPFYLGIGAVLILVGMSDRIVAARWWR